MFNTRRIHIGFEFGSKWVFYNMKNQRYFLAVTNFEERENGEGTLSEINEGTVRTGLKWGFKGIPFVDTDIE